MNGWQVEIRENPAMLGADVYIFYRRYDGKTIIFKDKEEVVVEMGARAEPSFHLTDEMLQAFANALSRVEIRPREASKTEGLLEAQSEHLKDLRKLLKL